MHLAAFVRPALLVVISMFAGSVVLAQEPAPDATAHLKYSNKWRIEVKEGANNDGVMRFRLTPEGEPAIDVTVNVRDGRSENGVARDVKNAFKSALDPKRFHVEGDDGEDVLLKKKGGPDFALQLHAHTRLSARSHCRALREVAVARRRGRGRIAADDGDRQGQQEGPAEPVQRLPHPQRLNMHDPDDGHGPSSGCAPRRAGQLTAQRETYSRSRSTCVPLRVDSSS